MFKIKLKPQVKRSALRVAMNARHGTGTKSMKDRRIPRGGARNKQRDFKDECF